ncbi:MAG: DUF177 domain-containing protein [Candidatus Melainabacteria bacterium]|nr:DUF177 domain-containing protein [Candidatus Melainabacteria bacterium]
MGISFKEQIPGLEAVKPVVGELTLSLDSWGLKLTGQVQTLLKLHCHRCLKAYFHSLSVDVDESFVHQTEMPRERELSHHDFVEPIPNNGVLDISDVVYQAVTLASPVYCLCGEDCPGPPVPQSAGVPKDKGASDKTQEYIDPRWQNLKTLLPNEKSGEGS